MGKNRVFFKMTYRQMVKNKVRTLVTVVGIILSAALITAVATFVSSLRNSMIEYKISETGNWHGAVKGIEKEEVIKKLVSSQEVADSFLAYCLGDCQLGSTDTGQQVVMKVLALDDHFMETIPIELISGRMPQNSREIVLDTILSETGNVADYSVGDVIECVSGKAGEYKSYTVVGFCQTASVVNSEFKSFLGYTKYDENMGKEYNVDVYFRMKKPTDVNVFLKQYQQEYEIQTNEGLLRLLGTSKYTSYYSFIYALAVIVIVLVMGGSVLLIYNSFVISMNERTKQFGLLSSIGATKAQLRASVLYEAFLVSAIGIPSGVFVGIAGIGTTLFCIRTNLKNIAASVISLGEMKLHISGTAIAVAVAAALVTVLVSAFIPMVRISRMSAMEAIRQNSDIRLSRRNVRCSKLFKKVFGFEGMLGRKNFKRSHKKYRTTIFSLFVSIVLFISASSLGHYLITSIEGVYKMGDYDIYYARDETGNTEEQKEKHERAVTQMKHLKYVTEAADALIASGYISQDGVNDAYYTQEYADWKAGNEEQTGGLVIVYGIDDAVYQAYLEQNGLSVSKYMDTKQQQFLVYANRRIRNAETGKTKDISVYRNGGFPFSLYFTDWEKYNELSKERNEQNQADKTDTELQEQYNQMEKECRRYVTFQVGETAHTLPYTVETERYYNGQTLLLCSKSMLEMLSEEQRSSRLYQKIFFKTTDHAAAAQEMREILKENNMNYQYALVDEAMEYESTRSMIFVIKVFSYGFLVMMSLIAMANVFNTISTNMMLRRREFAMLKSVGLTEKSFHKMLFYECLIYGFKALLFGIPASLGMSWWIYKSVNDLWVMGFDIPWAAILISVLSVYFIVLVTMIYSKKKLQKLNLIGCIKEENI